MDELLLPLCPRSRKRREKITNRFSHMDDYLPYLTTLLYRLGVQSTITFTTTLLLQCSKMSAHF